MFVALRDALSALAVLFGDPQRDRENPLEVVFIHLLLSTSVFYFLLEPTEQCRQGTHTYKRYIHTKHTGKNSFRLKEEKAP